MKPQVLLLYIDSSAKLGILPYLSAIFSSHLDFDSIQIDQLNPEVITKYQLVLFSSALCESRVNEIIKEKGPIGVGKAVAKNQEGKITVSAELTFAIG